MGLAFGDMIWCIVTCLSNRSLQIAHDLGPPSHSCETNEASANSSSVVYQIEAHARIGSPSKRTRLGQVARFYGRALRPSVLSSGATVKRTSCQRYGKRCSLAAKDMPVCPCWWLWPHTCSKGVAYSSMTIELGNRRWGQVSSAKWRLWAVFPRLVCRLDGQGTQCQFGFLPYGVWVAF